MEGIFPPNWQGLEEGPTAMPSEGLAHLLPTRQGFLCFLLLFYLSIG